jgi:hypothetical protein
MLDGRYDDIKSGRVKPIDGEAFLVAKFSTRTMPPGSCSSAPYLLLKTSLSLLKILSGANTLKINDMQEHETGTRQGRRSQCYIA